MKVSKNLTSIIMPFYNEENFLEKSALNLVKENFNKEIILVNDGSNDRSLEIATELEKIHKEIKLIDNKENMGKGYAVKLGLGQVSGNIVGIFDADLEYSTQDLKNLINLLVKDNFDFVCGSRFIGTRERKNIYFRTFMANKFLSFLFSVINRNKITDIATCLKVFKKDLLKDINLEKNDFSIEIELIAKALSKTTNYKELPISYNGRSYSDGKKIKLIDGFRYIAAIFKYK
tara:strand:- start:729 stop:1424 length:696 start_codon:yes stop_codon:yes gene_type:complete